MLATSLPVAQWLERPTGVRKVMGSILVGDSDFFFVPCSRHVDYSIFSYLIVYSWTSAYLLHFCSLASSLLLNEGDADMSLEDAKFTAQIIPVFRAN